MQNVFKNLMNQLKETKTISVDIGFGTTCETLRKDVAIEIVKQAAEEYNNVMIDGKCCFQTCACTEQCDKCRRLCNGDTDYYETIEEAFDNWIKEYNNGWIPVSDQLPTVEEYQRGNGRFLVTDGNRVYEAEYDIYGSHTFGKSQMAANWSDSFVTDKRITHWQNEPLPPKTCY